MKKAELTTQTPADAKPVLAEVPCKKHKPKQLDYLAWHDWAEKMQRQGKEQTQCKKCGRWYFKSEM
jgi:hypothetical protein